MNLDDKGKTLENFTPRNNFVLIKPFLKDSETGEGGLSYDTSFEQVKHAPRRGIVAAVPEGLVYHPKRNPSISWDTDMELIVGDEVTFHFLSGMTAENAHHERLIVSGGEKYYLIQYERLFTVKRKGYATIEYGDIQCGMSPLELIKKRNIEGGLIYTAKEKKSSVQELTSIIICLNGFVLIEPIDDVFHKPYTNILVIPKRADKYFGIVRYIGSCNRGYRDSHKQFHGPDIDNIKVGETVVMDNVCDIPLEYPLHARLEGSKIFYRVQRRYILGSVEI